MDNVDILRESVKKIKIGRYIVIDDIPCKVVNIETSAPGKHGHAKVRITAIGVFDSQKKTLLKPSDAEVEVPIIKKKRVQVVSINGSSAQLMDPETYEIYELKIPGELSGKFEPGSELEVIEVMGQRQISRIMSNE